MDYSQLNWFEKLLVALGENVMATPTTFGWFHLLFFFLTIAATVLLCIFFRDSKEKIFRRIVLIGWIIIVILEIGKELTWAMHFDVDTKKYSWQYEFAMFPFQFCSTPFYIFPFVALLKDCKVRKCFISYTAFYVLFAGLAVMFAPSEVFCGKPFINIQTMVHHGMMIVIGIYTLVYYRKSINFLSFLYSVPLFILLVGIAIGLNEIFFFTLNRSDIQMFFISRHTTTALLVLRKIYPHVPFAVFVMIYVFGFILVAAIINIAFIYIYRLVIHCINKRNKDNKKEDIKKIKAS